MLINSPPRLLLFAKLVIKVSAVFPSVFALYTRKTDDVMPVYGYRLSPVSVIPSCVADLVDGNTFIVFCSAFGIQNPDVTNRDKRHIPYCIPDFATNMVTYHVSFAVPLKQRKVFRVNDCLSLSKCPVALFQRTFRADGRDAESETEED